MDNYNPGPNAAPQPGNNDPNVTRYFPAGEGNAPAPQQEANAGRVEAPRQAYAPPPGPGSYAAQGAEPPPQPTYQGQQYAGQQAAQAPQQPYPGQQYQGQVWPNQHQHPHQHPHGVQPANGHATPADKHDRDRTTLGIILIGGGLLFLLNQLSAFGGFGRIVPLLIGGAFLYAYFRTRQAYRIGFLIPGAILTGIGVGEVIENYAFFNLGGDVTAVTLGLGFCSIWFFERRHWWSLIPGSILVLSGLSQMYLIGRLWPIVLIAIGVYLLYGQSRRRV